MSDTNISDLKSLPAYNNSHHLNHIIETQQFDVETIINWIFPLADKMRLMIRLRRHLNKKELFDPLSVLINNHFENQSLISWFEEPSTRTEVSFAMAIRLLGGQVSFATENAAQFSSRAKGESISDTFRILSSYYPHVIAARFAKSGDAALAATASEAPIINAGDGNNQHPTQALLDLYTIKNKFKKISGLKIALVGDLHNGRTVKSLTYLASKFPNINLYFVSPDSLKVGTDLKGYLIKHEIHWEDVGDLRNVAGDMDVVYMTRTQLERGSYLSPEEKEPGRFSINQEILTLLPAKSIIMHPLPRQEEIPNFVDSDPRAYYFTQAQNGLFIRMALLLMILKPDLVEEIVNFSIN